MYNGIGNINNVITTTSSGSTSTQSFTYGDSANPDRLTKFGSKAITYNTMGCPLSYDGWNFTWKNGKLNSVTKGSPKVLTSPHESYSYTYNTLGQRTAKNYTYRPINFSSPYTYLQNAYTQYNYDNSGRLIREKRTYSYSDSTSYSLEFIFLYDESGIVGVQFKDGNATPQAYYYQRNLQGDVVAIYNTAGTVQAKYKYDAFGNCTVTNSTNLHLATYNPIRYRGYYYDDETKWYFLNARYYSPEFRRFISPDDTSYLDPESANGLNLYAYCNNDPINYADPSGCFALTAFGVWAIVGIVSAAMVLGGGAQLVSNALTGQTGSELWRGVAGSALGSGANALALCLLTLTGGALFAASALIGASVQTGVDTIETFIRGENVSLEQTALDFGINFATTFAGNWLGATMVPINAEWFKPQRFPSVFIRPYGQKILLQTAIGAGLSGVVNFTRKYWDSIHRTLSFLRYHHLFYQLIHIFKGEKF